MGRAVAAFLPHDTQAGVEPASPLSLPRVWLWGRMASVLLLLLWVFSVCFLWMVLEPLCSDKTEKSGALFDQSCFFCLPLYGISMGVGEGLRAGVQDCGGLLVGGGRLSRGAGGRAGCGRGVMGRRRRQQRGWEGRELRAGASGAAG